MDKNSEKDRAERLKEARLNAGYQTATDFIRKHGFVETTYLAHERGSRNFKYAEAEKYAALVGRSVEWIWTGNKTQNKIASIPIVGIIKIGGLITASHPLTGNISMNKARTERPRMAEAPPESDADALFGLTVETSQFLPYFKEGSIVYYSRTPLDPEKCIGEPCVIQIKGGNAVFAVLLRGSYKGVYDIQGHGKNLEIDWCAWVEYTKRARSDAPQVA
jgi:hypothetical protein